MIDCVKGCAETELLRIPAVNLVSRFINETKYSLTNMELFNTIAKVGF